MKSNQSFDTNKIFACKYFLKRYPKASIALLFLFFLHCSVSSDSKTGKTNLISIVFSSDITCATKST
jgi:hypothetical protein